MPMGVDGFSYADLHAPARLRDLHAVFGQGVAAADPHLWTEWSAYAASPDAPRPAIEVSDLIVRMAPYVTRCVSRRFQIDEATAGAVAGTRALDALFRFKVDFVRRRRRAGARPTGWPWLPTSTP